MMIFMLLFWVLLIAGAVVAAGALFPGTKRLIPPTGRPDPLAILDERYARGDIGREEYLLARRDLAS